MDKNTKINWKTVFVIGGAFTAYCIGAGFSSGQEALQYFGTWGGAYPFILPLICFVLVLVYCISNYKVGWTEQFENPNDAYNYYCGKKLGTVMNIFCNTVIALTSLVMFAGSGATVNQYLGIPVWVGAVVMGIVSAFVVCLGLEKVTDVLGCAGVLIIIIMAIAGFYCFFTTPVGITEAQQHVLEYVDEGIFLQAQLFGIRHPIVSVLSYVGVSLSLIVVFNVALGSKCKNKKEVLASGICSAVLFTIGLVMVLYTMLLNLDYIAEKRAQVPMLAAIEKVLPALALPFAIVIVVGIFTTITGYLWAVGRRFAEDKTAKQRIVVIAMTAVGISIGSLIPLDKLVNAVYPFTGIAGIIIFICILVRELTMKKNAPPTETAPENQAQ